MRRGVALALISGNAALALAPLFVRAADVGPTASAMWRMVLAVPFLIVIAGMTRLRVRLEKPSSYGLMVFAGAIFAADLAVWHVGILNTKLGNAALLGNTATIFFPLWGLIVARSMPSAAEASALGLAALGGFVLLSQSAELSPANLFGDTMCLLAGLLYTAFLVLIARARTELPSFTLLFWTTIGSIPFLAGLAVGLGETIMPRRWDLMIGLALTSQVVGQLLLIHALVQARSTLVGIALLLQPMISALAGLMIFGERMQPIELIGAAMIATSLCAIIVLERRNAAPVERL